MKQESAGRPVQNCGECDCDQRVGMPLVVSVMNFNQAVERIDGIAESCEIKIRRPHARSMMQRINEQPSQCADKLPQSYGRESDI